MNPDVWGGTSIVLSGGVLQGIFAVPMKFARRWNYENIWFVFAFTGLIVFPWILAWSTIPRLGETYHLAPAGALISAIGFGVCWGIGATLTGLGLNMLGIGLGFAIILGLSASMGSLIPFVILTPERIGTSQGRAYLVGTAVMLAGIAVAARAGALRDRGRPERLESEKGTPFLTGLLITIAAGLFSSTLNFSYAFGRPVIDQALSLGVSQLWAANAITALATTGGFFANLIYCGFLLRRNGTTRRFVLPGAGINWIYGATMGAFWLGGQALYGVGVSRMGDFGTVIGWPLLMGTIILSSNIAGFLTGEWKQATLPSRLCLFAGMAIALGILAMK